MFPIDIDVLGLFQLGSDFTLKYFILQNELLKWLTCDFFFFFFRFNGSETCDDT